MEDINLNLDDENPHGFESDVTPKLHLRTEPDDIFEDIPDPVVKMDSSTPFSHTESVKPEITSPRTQVTM